MPLIDLILLLVCSSCLLLVGLFVLKRFSGHRNDFDGWGM
jgi:hypothetical protein